ncbi:MAG: hypothetical protein ACTHNU_00210 [Gaiellales bacterium]
MIDATLRLLGRTTALLLAPAKLRWVSDVVFVIRRGSQEATYHEPADPEPGRAQKTQCGLVVGGITPLMRRELAAESARPCPRCYLIPHLDVAHAGRASALAEERWKRAN